MVIFGLEDQRNQPENGNFNQQIPSGNNTPPLITNDNWYSDLIKEEEKHKEPNNKKDSYHTPSTPLAENAKENDLWMKNDSRKEDQKDVKEKQKILKEEVKDWIPETEKKDEKQKENKDEEKKISEKKSVTPKKMKDEENWKTKEEKKQKETEIIQKEKQVNEQKNDKKEPKEQKELMNKKKQQKVNL